jgi:DNA polymerase III alpha subunit
LLPVDIQKRFDKLYGFTAYNTPKAIAVQNRSKVINKLAWQLKNEENYKLIISSIAHFIEEDDKIVQDCKMKNAKEQFAILESHLGEFSIEHWNECKANAEEIVALAKDIKIVHKYHLPKIEIPKTILAKTEDYDKQTYYLMMAKIKEHGRWNDSPEYISRFKKEIDVIWKNEAMNFIPYFLVYEDIGNYARSQGILQGLARGSAGGCLISYYLKITHLDPIACDLPFERFLSHARIKAGSWPDIDCLDGDTLISLSNGQKISIRELSNLHASDYPELLSLSTSGIIPQKPVLIFKKGQAEVVQYNFEDGSVLTCTADHRVLTKEVGYIEIQKAFENGYDIVDYR